MATDYPVEQGDHMVKIAAKFGFGDFNTIWNHAKNEELKKKRGNPNVLFPGDLVHIPDKKQKQESKPTEASHKFKAQRPKLMLRLTLKGPDGKPLSGKKITLKVEGDSFELSTDGNGAIQQKVKPMAENGKVIIKELSIEAPLKIGHLDPAEEVSGYRARLNNLGFAAGSSDDSADPRLRSAVEEFQCNHGLTVTGDVDDETRDKLKEAHGC
jgi:N-acetylmuramoyl-L-alanine amidase